MRVDIIVPAGGSGKRMGGTRSKQFIELAGMPILARTLKVFEKIRGIDGVVLVVPLSEIDFAKKEVVERYNLSRVRKVVAGGEERQDSVRNGLSVLERGSAADLVMIHDAVRPFVTEEQILKSIDECRKHGAVTLGMAVTDTVKEVNEGGIVGRTVDRGALWLTQTPQTFRRSVIEEAYRRAYEDGFRGTDDASLVERIGIRVLMIPGSQENIKITTPRDLEHGEWIVKKRQKAQSLTVNGKK